MWIKVIDDEIIESALLPNGTINATSEVDLSGINWYFLEATQPPECDDLTHKILDATFNSSALILNGKAQQRWEITEKSPEEKRNLVPIVGMAQARKALFQTGKLELVNAAVQQSGGIAAIDWEYATEVHRDSPLVTAFVQQFGWTEDEVNELFQLAVTL